jgi:hypothetical protein
MKRIICSRSLLKFLLTLTLVCSFSQINLAQTDEDAPVQVPDTAMAQVVRRILTWYFKPRSKPKTIYLSADGIKKEWLPEIKNIEFLLLSDEEIEQMEGVYFFKKLGFLNGKYEIGFAFGNPNCSYSGLGVWNFRITKQTVRLWELNGGFGGGCASGSGTVTSGFYP